MMMDEKVKTIYLAMIKPLRHWPSSIPVWRELMEKSKITTTQEFEDRRGKISGAWWQHFKSSDGVWQNWAHGYEKEIKRIVKEFNRIKASIVITDDIKKAAEALGPVVESGSWDLKIDKMEKAGVIPFRDRKHTKGVFRRANNSNDESGDE
jgi:predicted transcriptional regulator